MLRTVALLGKRRKGVGGLFFVFTALIGALTMVVVTDMGKTTTITAVSSNIAHVIATKTAIFSYNNSLQSYDISNTVSSGEESYSPLQDFNDMAAEYGFLKLGASVAKVSWDFENKVAKVDVGIFTCDCNTSGMIGGGEYKDMINPPEQTVKIENE